MTSTERRAPCAGQLELKRIASKKSKSDEAWILSAGKDFHKEFISVVVH